MPKQSSSKKTSKKATSRAMTMYRSPRDMQIFKPVTTKLVYTDTVLLASTGAVAFNTYTFRSNSVFDPDWTSVSGHQPTRFDQLSALYQRYEVLKSKIRVQFTTGDVAPTSTTVALGPWHVGVVCSSAATPAGTGTDQDTHSQSHLVQTMAHFAVKWSRRARPIGTVVSMVLLSMTTASRRTSLQTQPQKDTTSSGRSTRAMWQRLAC